MACFEINRAGDAVVERFFPTGYADAPFVARLKPGKFPLRVWCDQVVSLQHRKIEKVTTHLRANRMQPDVAGARTTVTVTVEAGEWIAAATLQLGAEDICGHGERITEHLCLSSRAMSRDPVEVTLKVSPRDLSTLLGMTENLARDQMARKAQAIAYWLLPERAAREVFSREIRKLARQLGAPLFEPHVTIFIASENSRPPLDVLQELGSVNIELTIHSIRFSEQFTKTLFVQFETNNTLQQLGDAIWKASGAQDRYLIDPHLSLVYAKLPPETKQRLADKIRLPFREVCFTSIWTMRCARPTTTAIEVEQWKLLAP
jgi:hypothetical protein